MEYVYIKENFLSQQVCSMLIEYFESTEENHFEGYFGKSKTLDYEIKKCDEMYLSEKLESTFVKSIQVAFDDYCKNHEIGGNFNFEKFRIKRYKNNGEDFFKTHTDISSLTTCKRIVAVIMYLNDVENGGETALYLNNAEHKIKPTTGKLLMFPANFCYPHAGLPPVSNNKYIMTTFICYA